MDYHADIVSTFIEVRLKTDFLIIAETLTRIGVASFSEKTLTQSCNILHKKKTVGYDKNTNESIRESRYYITHFKEMFKLDNKPSSLTIEDISRRNCIANLLAHWGFIELVDQAKSKTPVCELAEIKIISSKQKPEWKLVSKYKIGSNKRRT